MISRSVPLVIVVVMLFAILARSTKDEIQAEEVVFVEYFYFVVYLVILLTSLHNFLFSLSKINARFIQYENSLIPKLVFWPLLGALIFGITSVLFY